MTTRTDPAPKGLSSVPQLHAILVPKGPERVKLAFPGTDLVAGAAALFHNSPWLLEPDPHRPGEVVGAEGRMFRVTISPGTVGLTMRDPARLERNRADGLGRLKGLPPGRVLDEDGAWSGQWREPYPARQVEGWSRKSRARMVRTLAQLDWTPMYADDRPAVMLTLTYPGDWLTVAPTGKAVKKHLEAFYARWQRRWGSPFVGPWKLEFQRRGAPHVHLLTVPPRDPAFRDWLSQTWAAVVAHPDVEERGRHVLAGTGVDHLRGGRCFDPKRAAVYFSKHGGAGGGKEYQHDVPEAWQVEGAGPGRFWGYKGLVKAVASVDVDLVEYVQLRRTLRRWAKQSGNSRRVVSERVDANGVVTYRTRRRKGVQSLTSRALTGGTVLVNDGPAFASALARLVNSK
jgi:hypothetical protein